MSLEVNRAPDRRVDLLWLAVPLVIYALHVWLFAAYVNDDAYITYRYSHFLANGLGPYYNIGEHVEGYTNFLLMLVLAAIDAIGGDAIVPLAAKIIGVLGGAGAIVASYFITRALTKDRGAAALAAAMIAVAPGYALNSTSGLETTLYGMLLTLGVLLGEEAHRRQSWRGAGIAFAAAALTRPEGAVIFGAYWLASMIAADDSSSRRRLLLDGCIVGGAIAAQLAFRWIAYDGEWLPNTFFAKLENLGKLGAWGYVRRGALVAFGGFVATTAALIVALVRSPDRRRWLVIAAPAIAGVLSPFYVTTDWMLGGRFLVPYLPMMAAVVATGWFGLLSLRLSAPARAMVFVAAIAALWVTQEGQRAEFREYVDTRAGGFKTGHRALAAWLKDHCAPGDTVAMVDIGIVGFTLPQQTILDVTGLTDRFIAKSPGPFLMKDYDPAYVFSHDPRYIVLVFYQPGNPAEIPSELVLHPLTWIEQKLFDHPSFQRDYRHPGATGDDWLDSIADTLGARKVFLHAYPKMYYFLAVFERAPQAK